MGMLKVKEAVYLLLNTMPELRELLFDFSEPHKIDLEEFMLTNFHYNVPVEKFARLTGRSLASFKRDFQKIFGKAPRQWLLEKRLAEARHLIEKRIKDHLIFISTWDLKACRISRILLRRNSARRPLIINAAILIKNDNSFLFKPHYHQPIIFL